MTAGNVSGASTQFTSSNRSLDFILAACDVEGNFLVVKAYQFTDLLSCMLLNSWALFPRSKLSVLIPLLNRWAISSCVFFSWLLMRIKYTWTQLAVCDRVVPVPSSFQLTVTIPTTLGNLDLRRGSWDARRIRSTHRQGSQGGG